MDPAEALLNRLGFKLYREANEVCPFTEYRAPIRGFQKKTREMMNFFSRGTHDAEIMQLKDVFSISFKPN